MAEDITLKGVKVIRYNSEKAGDFKIVIPKRGGDTHLLPQWWDTNPKCISYLDCTVLEINGDHLVIPTQMQSELRLSFDGTSITFHSWRGIERAALFAPGTYGKAGVKTDFIFPAIGTRGAKVASIDGPAAGPPAPPATSIGTVTVAGESAPSDGDSEVYSASISGDAGGLSYSWSATGTGSVTAGGATASATIRFTGAGESTITCEVSSTDAGVTDSPASGDLTVTSA